MSMAPEGSAAPMSALQDALESANLPTLLAALTHLTGERRWLEPPYRPAPARGPGDNDTGGLPEDVQAYIRAQAMQVLLDFREGRRTPVPPPDAEDVARILGASLGEEVPPEAGPLLAEELGISDRATATTEGTAQHVLVIGAGLSGLAAAVRLKASDTPFTVVERNADVGGTWFENRYPGCGVDTPVHLYSYAFAQQPSWSKYFARQPDVLAYIEKVVDTHDLRPHIRFSTEVVSARWDADTADWEVVLREADGAPSTVRTPILVSAVGLFGRPAVPQITGLETFEGQCVHTADWPADLDVSGRRVGVIGTGASSMQLVPAIAGTAAHLTVFQRTPQWAVPNPNTSRKVSPAVQLLMEQVPHYLGWYRLRQAWIFGDRLHASMQIDPAWPEPDTAINKINDRHRRFLLSHIEHKLQDRPDLVQHCVPDYPPYGKRPLLDHGWYDALRRPDVSLVSGAVAEMRQHGVVDATGTEHPVDVLVLATGFQVLDLLGPMQITGRSGRTLREVWGPNDARAYLGMTVPDFPNFFILFGPNTHAGHGGSHIMSAEVQVRYLMQVLGEMNERRIASIECRPEVFEDYNAALDEALSTTIWSHPNVHTYYRNSRGRIVTNLPWTNAHYRQLTDEVDLADYVVTAAAEQAQCQGVVQ
jgi:4-hydroxyacetophenone monooxygenase